MYTIVYFWADWCPLCKSFKKEFIAELVPYFSIEAVNVSEEPYKATKHKITKLPWAILVKDGEVIEKSVSYKDLFRIIEKYYTDEVAEQLEKMVGLAKQMMQEIAVLDYAKVA